MHTGAGHDHTTIFLDQCYSIFVFCYKQKTTYYISRNELDEVMTWGEVGWCGDKRWWACLFMSYVNQTSSCNLLINNFWPLLQTGLAQNRLDYWVEIPPQSITVQQSQIFSVLTIHASVCLCLTHTLVHAQAYISHFWVIFTMTSKLISLDIELLWWSNC